MEFHLFHSVNSQVLIEKNGVISEETERQGVPEELKKFEIDIFPGQISKGGVSPESMERLQERASVEASITVVIGCAEF